MNDNEAFSKSERCAVLRQDDNGNTFVVEAGLSREQAESLVAEFERKGHKQHYWVSRESEFAATNSIR